MSQKLYLALLLHKKTINICNNTKYGIYFSVKCSNLTSVTQVLEIPLINQSDYKIYYNTKYGNMPLSPLSKNSYSPFINRILSSIQHIQNTGGGGVPSSIIFIFSYIHVYFIIRLNILLLLQYQAYCLFLLCFSDFNFYFFFVNNDDHKLNQTWYVCVY